MGFIIDECFKKPNKTKYYVIQFETEDNQKITYDKYISSIIDLTTKQYRNILRGFNAEMKYESDNNIVFKFKKDAQEAIKKLDELYNGIVNREPRIINEQDLRKSLIDYHLQQTKAMKDAFNEDNILTQMFGSILQGMGESIDDFRKLLDEDYEKAVEFKEEINKITPTNDAVFRKFPTDAGYIYGECTNEFCELNIDVIPTINDDDVFMNSMNRTPTPWDILGKYYKLEENFIEEFMDKIDLIQVSKYQNLTMDFILKYQDKLDLDIMSTNVKLSQEIKNKAEELFTKKSQSNRDENIDEVSKNMLGDMLGLSPEQLAKIGNVVQIGGPQQDQMLDDFGMTVLNTNKDEDEEDIGDLLN